MNWLRLYVDLPRDHKIRREPLATRWAWIAAMTLTRRSPVPPALLLAEGVPVSVEDVADEANISGKAAAAAMATFIARRMIHVATIEGGLDVWVMTNWRKRQPNSDDVAARVDAHRKRSRNVTGNVTETPPDTDTDTDTDTEVETETEASTQTEHALQEQTAGAGAAAPESAKPARAIKVVEPDTFETRFWRHYPRHIAKAVAKVAYEKKRKGGVPVDVLERSAQNFAIYIERRGTDDEFTPHAATFLNQDRWQDFRDGVPEEVVRSNGKQAGTALAPKSWSALQAVHERRIAAEATT